MRVKGGVKTRRRHKRVLQLAKGYKGVRHTHYRIANQQVMKSLQYAYRDRRQRKRDFRKLWIARINAGARMYGLSYSNLMHGLKLAGISLNRKMLAEMAIQDPKGFAQLVEAAKTQLQRQDRNVQGA